MNIKVLIENKTICINQQNYDSYITKYQEKVIVDIVDLDFSIDKFIGLYPRDLSDNIARIIIDDVVIMDICRISLNIERREIFLFINFVIDMDIDKYVNILRLRMNNYGCYINTDKKDKVIVIGLKFDRSKDIYLNIDDLINNFRRIHKDILNDIGSDINSSINLQFKFPQNISYACEQYITYFGKFLLELGIDSKSSTINNAGEILFSIIPKDKNQAMGAIYHALSIYLNLPLQYINGNITISKEDSKFQDILSNINHLENQIALALEFGKAQLQIIDSHKTTIESQKLTIALQQQIIDRIHPERKEEIQSDDLKEEVLGGLVKFGEAKVMEGIIFDLGEVIRRWKRYWNKSL